MSFRRKIQIFCLAIFLLLLLAATTGWATSLALDFFLRLDPSLVMVSGLAARILLFAFLPAVWVVVLTVFFGRFFCGYICPMGTTLDGGDALLKIKYKNQKRLPVLHRLKYLVLSFLIGAGFLGVSFVFIASPLSLITRFYSLLVQPVLALATREGLSAMEPVFVKFSFDSLLFFQVDTPRFSTQGFILFFFVLVFILGRWFPRFWCRTLCPAGAILALISIRPLIRRQVSPACTDCGKCIRNCPMGAINDQDYSQTDFRECIVCHVCTDVCPEKAITFDSKGSVQPWGTTPKIPSRRQFLLGGMTGVGSAMVCYSGLDSLYGQPGEGQVLPSMLIRPPAALPEKEFLARCVRCGECMAVCPTNTLQPLWFKAGLIGMFSPAMIARRGFCNPECHLCSEVCPTGAILQVTPTQRVWAKTGTAVIKKERCLAWEHEKQCMVCDEVCPFDAIVFRQVDNIPFAVPEVFEERCAGCGYCEFHCPVQNESAIVVTPMGAARLKDGKFKEYGIHHGLQLSLKKEITQESDNDAYEDISATGDSAPGFTD